MPAPLVLHDAEIAIAEERIAKFFVECETCGGLLEFACCRWCEPEKHAACRDAARAVARAEFEKAERERAERNKPLAELADAVETRRDAAMFAGLCAALRNGSASYLQIKLARRLTSPRAMKRHRRKP